MSASFQAQMLDLARLPPEDELDVEIVARMRHLAAKLIIEPDHRVLLIGSGESSFARYLREVCRAKLSATNSIDDARGPFDRLVSIGAFEQERSFRAFFSTAFQKLERNSIALLQGIAQHAPARSGAPAISEIMPSVEKTRFLIKDLEILQGDQASFLAKFAERAVTDDLSGSLREQAGLLADGERFVYQLQISPFQDSIPFTRDYIAERSADLQARERELGFSL
ncbi:MAG: hypothetical protein AAF441_13985 [Pseudomonadota bacterium]